MGGGHQSGTHTPIDIILLSRLFPFFCACMSSHSGHFVHSIVPMIFQAYIFDIRAGAYLHKLTGHTDTVTDVAFHPLLPQVGLTQSTRGQHLVYVPFLFLKLFSIILRAIINVSVSVRYNNYTKSM